MTKKHSNKKALIASFLVLALCFTSFLATTFAWFTDSVTSANNIIKSGNLDIELKYAKIDGDKITGWDTVGGKDNIFDKNALWEPGRVEVVYLEVSNLGTLALKYQLGVNVAKETPGTNVNGEEIMLSKHLVFKVVELEDMPTTPYTRESAINAAGTVKGLKDYNGKTTPLEKGATDYVALIVYMPESVGNEANYRGDSIPTIELGINLYATQQTAEEDSFGSDYDAGANHEKFKVTNANDLQNAANDAKPGDVIEVVNDIVLTAPIVIPPAQATLSMRSTPAPVVIDLNGKTITTSLVEGSTTNHLYAFENYGNLVITGNGTINARGIFNYGNMVLENGTINAIDGNGGYAVRNYDGATFTMNGGTIATTFEDDHKVDKGGYDATTVRVDEGATFVMNGGVINNICDFTFAIDNAGTTIVNAGTVSSVHTTVANYGTMEINGGTFTCNGLEGVTAHAVWASSGITTVNGGTFNGKDNYNGFNIDASKGAVVNVYGGNFLPVHSGSLYGEGTINVYGGTFFDDPSARVSAGYKVEQVDGAWVVSVAIKTAEDLQDAINNAKDGETIYILQDITSVDGVLISNKNLTIDLGGHTFSVSEGASVSNRNIKIIGSSNVTVKNGTLIASGNTTSGAYGTIRTEGTANVTLENLNLYNYRGGGLNIKAVTGTTVTINNCNIYSQYGGGVEASGGTIVLNDTKIEQKGVYTNGWYSVAMEINSSGKITVNSGEYSGSAIATDSNAAMGNCVAFILSSGGTLNINGGTFNGTVAETATASNFCGLIYADRAAVVNINGGTFNSNGAILDMRNNAGSQPNPVATISGGTFTADPRVSGLYASNLITIADGYEVVVNDDGTYAVSEIKDILVSTFDELKAAIAAGGKIKLVNDIEVSETIAVNAEVVLNLNGYNITAGYQAGSTTKHLYPFDVYGTLTIMGDGSISGRGIYVQEGSKLILEGGSIYGIDSNGGSAIWQYGGDVIVNGGHIEQKAEGTYNFAINGLGGTVTVNGGWIGGNHGAIATAGASVIINDGELVCTGTSGMTDNVLYSYSNGSIVINGGSFTADKDIPAGGCCIYDANGKVTVNGGTFGNSSGGDVWGTTGTTIKGGTFENLTEKAHISDGYEAVSNPDGSVTITKK